MPIFLQNKTLIPDEDVYLGTDPVYLHPPRPVRAWNVGQYTIIIEFNHPLTAVGLPADWTITSMEFSTVPGDPVFETYSVDSIEIMVDTKFLQINLTAAGRLTYPTGPVSIFFSGELIGWYGMPIDDFTKTFLAEMDTYAFDPIIDDESFTLSALLAEVLLVRIYFSDYFSGDDENFTLSTTFTEALLYSIYSPILLSVQNIPDGEADYGHYVEFLFDQPIRNAESFPADFTVEDFDGNITRHGVSAVRDGRKVTVYFDDFNDGDNDFTAIALAGNLTNGLTALTETSVEFTAEGLVPTYIPAPVPTTIENVDGQTILIMFDRAIVEIVSQAGFVVSGYEFNRVPGGDLVAVTYDVDAVVMAPGALSASAVTLASGGLTDVEVV